jgi:hypothetical protein
METSLLEITKEFQRECSPLKHRLNFSEICAKIHEFVGVRRDAILLAWFAEYGFNPGKAVLVEEREHPFKTYIRECTAEEGERATTAANNARQEICGCDNREYWISCIGVLNKKINFCPSCGRKLSAVA